MATEASVTSDLSVIIIGSDASFEDKEYQGGNRISRPAFFHSLRPVSCDLIDELPIKNKTTASFPILFVGGLVVYSQEF